MVANREDSIGFFEGNLVDRPDGRFFHMAVRAEALEVMSADEQIGGLAHVLKIQLIFHAE